MRRGLLVPCSAVVIIATVLFAETETQPAGEANRPYLLKNINPAGSSEAGGFVTFNGITYFRANDGAIGSELWRTDGTDAGTSLVSDINVGNLSSSPLLSATVFAGRLYFAASSTMLGRELWASDGSTAGTTLVADINTGPPDADPTWFLPIGATLYFRAQDPAGLEIWKSDGTAAGTMLIADIHPGSEGSIPTYLTELGGLAYFAADDTFTPGIGFDRELWRTDGTVQGTVRVKDINPGPAPSIPGELTRLRDRIVFNAGDATFGVELWTTDGTDAGTVRLADINPGPASSFPSNLGRAGNLIYFAANDGVSGRELWTSDGTPAGTRRVKDINPGGDSTPLEPTPFRDGLVFQADDGEHGRELWFTDGTDEGTRLIKDITPGPANSSPLDLTVAGNEIYVAAIKPSGTGDNTVLTELWKTDATDAGTVLVWQAPGRLAGYAIREIAFSGRHLFFVGPTAVDANGISADFEPYAIRIPTAR